MSDKNCETCRHGYWESEGDYGEHNYFVCEKREDNGYNNFDNNIIKESYRKKYKRCFEPLFLATCKTCGLNETSASKPSKDWQCFGCWWQDKELEKQTGVK